MRVVLLINEEGYLDIFKHMPEDDPEIEVQDYVRMHPDIIYFLADVLVC